MQASADYSFVCRNGTNFESEDPAVLSASMEKHEGALLLLLGFGSLSIILAVVYIVIRRLVFDDVNNLDSSFDAGGNVSTSLTAVTLASQLLWPGDLMQVVTICVKYGIAGAFWYCASSIINISLFPLLSFKFKTRAPGAKTFLQLIKARFGTPTHIVFTCFALMVNFIILASIFVGGIAVLSATIEDASPEFCVLVFATLCGSYALIGGLGSTFYVSYFNASTTFLVLSVLIYKVLHSDDKPFGTIEQIYERVNCLPPIDGNKDGTRFTFLSKQSLIFGLQSLFLISSVTYCDQASWQSRIAAKPLQGAVGFLIGGFLWFSVPSSIGLIAGITYVSEAALDQSNVLSIKQIDSGVVSAYMAEKAMGSAGGIMMLTMFSMLTMSTGSGEIMGVCSIIIYDIYQTYIRPFRRFLPSTHCICCGLEGQKWSSERRSSNPSNGNTQKCSCPPVSECHDCKEHDRKLLLQADTSPSNVIQYTCPYHAAYRLYQDSLISFKNWCVLWVSAGLIPFGLILNAAELDLNWTMLTGVIFVVPSCPGVILTIVWVKTTSIGMLTGCISGLISGVTANLLVSSLNYEWEGGFIRATSEPYSVLAGSVTAFTISITLTILVSLATHQIKTEEDRRDEWQKLRDIDNPLHPWSLHYADDFPESRGMYRPSEKEMDYDARYGKYAAIIGSIIFFVVFIILTPSILSSLEVLSVQEFRHWAYIITTFLFIATLAIIVVTPVEEVRSIIKQLRKRRKTKSGASVKERAPVYRATDGESGEINRAFDGSTYSNHSSTDKHHAYEESRASVKEREPVYRATDGDSDEINRAFGGSTNSHHSSTNTHHVCDESDGTTTPDKLETRI